MLEIEDRARGCLEASWVVRCLFQVASGRGGPKDVSSSPRPGMKKLEQVLAEKGTWVPVPPPKKMLANV